MSPALKPPPGRVPPLYLGRQDEVYWLKSLPELDAFYVQINAVANDEEESLAVFAEHIGSETEKPEIRNLILNIRQSPGGEPSGSRPNALSKSGNFRLPFSGLSGLLSERSGYSHTG